MHWSLIRRQHKTGLATAPIGIVVAGDGVVDRAAAVRVRVRCRRRWRWLRRCRWRRRWLGRGWRRWRALALQEVAPSVPLCLRGRFIDPVTDVVCPALGPSSRSFAWRSRRRRTCFCRIIVLNTKFLVFDTQFLVFNGKWSFLLTGSTSSHSKESLIWCLWRVVPRLFLVID